MVISTVPAGVADPFAAVLSAVPVLVDVIYGDRPTPLVEGRSRHLVTVTGLDMLLHQAYAQFPLITGAAAPREAMRAALTGAPD
jgi:shikimate dehydrogenase